VTKIIFYAWPSAFQNHRHRQFIRSALQEALQPLADDAIVIEVERAEEEGSASWTGDVPGTQAHSQGRSSLSEIESAHIFVPDFSAIALSEKGEALIDPRILIEYGYALGKLGSARILPILNTALGKSDTQTQRLDRAHRQRLVTYHLQENAGDEEQAIAQHQLVEALTAALQPILATPEANTKANAKVKILNGYELGQQALLSTHPPIIWNNNLKIIRRDARQAIEQVSANVNTQVGGNIFLYLNQSLVAFENYVAFALAGVESQQEPFNQQIGVMHDLLDCHWPDTGVVRLVEIPYTLASLFQVVYGGLCLATNQINLVFQIAYTSFRQSAGEYQPLVRNESVFGFPKTIGSDQDKMWSFYKDLPEIWPWLLDIFDDRAHFVAAISAYCLTLDIFELISSLASYTDASGNEFCLVPLCFIDESNEILRQAISMVQKNFIPLQAVCKSYGVTWDQLQAAWPQWTQRAIAYNPEFELPHFSHPYKDILVVN
jgi:hypothetical protein